jgi:hypothetical protein
MWIIQLPTSSLFPALLPCARARSELLNISLVPPRVEFYTALHVSIVGSYFAQGVFSHVDYTWSYSQTKPTLWVPCLPSFCQLIIAFLSFLSGYDQISPSQPLAVASILWLRIKTPPRLFRGKHGCLMAALGRLWQSLEWSLLSAYPLRWGYRFPLSILFDETLDSVSNENWHVMCTTQPALLWTHFTSWDERQEIKREKRGLNLRPIWKAVRKPGLIFGPEPLG